MGAGRLGTVLQALRRGRHQLSRDYLSENNFQWVSVWTKKWYKTQGMTLPSSFLRATGKTTLPEGIIIDICWLFSTIKDLVSCSSRILSTVCSQVSVHSSRKGMLWPARAQTRAVPEVQRKRHLPHMVHRTLEASKSMLKNIRTTGSLMLLCETC